jgi:hypothetical protein
MTTTKKQTMKHGTAMANGARGPRAKLSAKKFATIPAMIAKLRKGLNNYLSLMQVWKKIKPSNPFANEDVAKVSARRSKSLSV